MEADAPLRLRIAGGPGFHFPPPPFSKSIKSVIVGVVSGDGGRQRRWGCRQSMRERCQSRRERCQNRLGGCQRCPEVVRVGGSVVGVPAKKKMHFDFAILEMHLKNA
jgi:hypothetical protein